jgi:hypothetical protein
MATIPVQVCGDHWINPEQVRDLMIANQSACHLVFEINTEGPSLAVLGILHMIDTTLADIGFDTSKVWIDRWHNSIEPIPYKRAFTPDLSHFFWMSDRYRHRAVPALAPSHVLGFFVGRATVPRAWIMYQLYQLNHHPVLFSLMQGSRLLDLPGPDDFDSWVPVDQATSFRQWWQAPPVSSLTAHMVRDQYDPQHNTNLDLIDHYGKFYLELVAESYCRGATFFPTEKTIRPLSMKKPMLVYGPRGYLARLRQLGFRTWHDYWDESYDDLEGPERWHMMLTVLTSECDRDWASMIKYMDPVLCHNREHLDHLINKHRPG